MVQVRHRTIVAVLLVLAGTAMGRTFHVPTATYPTIQAAIDAAASGDKIVVAPGTYTEDIDLLGKAVRLYSSSGDPTNTTIQGTGHGPVVTCANQETSTTILEGFTITGGNIGADGWGGGMRNAASGPTVTNCTFSNNSGDGMVNAPGGSPTVTDCSFSNNSGDGMYNLFGSPTIINCSFERNTNGMYNHDYSNPTVSGCIFRENSDHGMVLAALVDVIVSNCTFIRNSGAGLHSVESYGTVTNCTFLGNSGGGMCNQGESPTATNCILWSNAGGPIVGDPGTVTYSDVEGSWAGEGNINADPLFVDAGAGDLHLAPGSPCIDAGTNSPAGGLPSTDMEGDPRPTDGDGDRVAVADMGAYEASRLRGPRK